MQSGCFDGGQGVRHNDSLGTMMLCCLPRSLLKIADAVDVANKYSALEPSTSCAS